MIFELYEQFNLTTKITNDIAYLLLAAILDNTLNFKAKITSNRDISAYNKILNLYQIKDSFEKQYFSECQKAIEENLEFTILNDTKIDEDNNLVNVFSQIVVYSKDIIIKQKDFIFNILNILNEDYALNLISLEENKSYILSKNIQTQKKFEKVFCKNFNDDIMDLEDLWLRKEILQKAQY